MMRRNYEEELNSLKEEVLFQGGQVKDMFTRTLAVLVSRDAEEASEIIDFDDRVDSKYVEIEHRVIGLLARHSPVAGDLRLVSSCLHINIHLERMADLCVNMAKMVGFTLEYSPISSIQETFQDMGKYALSAMDVAQKAFEKEDVGLAKTLPELDAPIDKLNLRIFKEIANVADDEDMLDWASRMTLVSRYLERMGDHAVDIGEQIAYMVTGEVHDFD